VFISGGVIATQIAAVIGSAAPITIYFAGAGLGIAFSGAVLPPLLIDPGRWPLAWAALAVMAALATAASWTAARDRGASTGRPESVPRLGARGSLWRLGAAYFLFAAGYIAYITFLSAYLARQHASVLQVGVTWVVLGLAAVAAPALWSRPVLAWPGRALTAVLACIAIAAAIALPGSPPAVTGSAALYGGTFLCVPAAVTAFIRDLVPRAVWTRALALLTVIFAAGQTAGPYLAGALADHYGPAATLIWTAALCAAASAIAASLPGGGTGPPPAER
jgi:predicted MFS family arabinose efflux permease